MIKEDKLVKNVSRDYTECKNNKKGSDLYDLKHSKLMCSVIETKDLSFIAL